MIRVFRSAKPERSGSTRASGRGRLALAALLMAALLSGCTKTVDPEVYVKDLGSPNEKARKKAVEELIRMHQDAIPAVTAALQNAPATDAGVLQAEGAIAVLTKNRTLESLEAVGAKIDDLSPTVRLAVVKGVRALAEVRKKRGIEFLTKSMHDSDAACVREGAKGLGNMDFEDATMVLKDFLDKGEGVQAVSAAEALYYFDKRPEATENLLESLSAADEAVSTAAQLAAVDMSVDKDLQNGFLTALADFAQEWPEAMGAAPVLAKARDKFFEKLQGPMAAAEERLAIDALGTMADPKSCEKLMEIIATAKDYSLSARVLAAGALGDAASSGRVTDSQLKGKILSTLNAMLTGEGIESPVRIACAISLCRLREVEGVTYLLAQLESLETGAKDQTAADAQALTELRIRAQEALTSSGKFIIPHLMNALRSEGVGDVTAWAAARTLGALRVDDAVPLIAPLLTATTKAQRVQCPKDDPTGELPLKTKAVMEKGETYDEALRLAAVQRSFVVGTLITFVVLGALCALLMLAVSAKQASPAVLVPIAVVVLAASLGAGKLYSNKVRNTLTPKTEAALRADVFAPTRQTVLTALFGDESVIPQRSPAVRIAAAEALGRIGGSDAEAALTQSCDVHINIRDKLKPLVERKRYGKLIPLHSLEEADERKASQLVDQLCQRVLREQEAALFYIRRALEECGQEVSVGPATE